MMIIDIDGWLEEIQTKVQSVFAGRVLFIGFQGSYRRGEATSESDIDMVVILDNLTLGDLKTYRQVIRSMPCSEKACGFISGLSEIANWSKADMFQFIYDTQPLFGTLDDIVTPLSRSDIERAVKTGSENLYHAACHCFLYDSDIKQSLAGLYKMVFFVLQAEHFLNTGQYVPTKKHLLEQLSGQDREILETCINRSQIADFDAEKIDCLYEALIEWSSRRIR